MNVKLYSGVPFDSNNKIIFASSTVRSSALNAFKVLEFSNNARFLNNDILEIDFSNNLSGISIYRVNYAIIEQYGIELCYYIDNAVVLAGGTVRFNCRIDNWQTFLRPEAQYVIDGNVEQTNISFSDLNNVKCYLPIAKRKSSSLNTTISLYTSDTNFRIVFLAQTKDTLNMFVTQLFADISTAINYIRQLGNVTRCGLNWQQQTQFKDVVISRAWLVPNIFIDASKINTSTMVYFTEPVVMAQVDQFITAFSYTQNPIDYIPNDAGAIYQNKSLTYTIPTNEKDFVEIGTFTSRITLSTEIANTRSVKIRCIISASGIVNITLEAEQKTIDLSNDYEVPVSYSESAQYYQHNVLKDTIKQVGSLVGLIASLATYNAVGAVMSGLSLASNVAGSIENMNVPMTLVGGGNGIETALTGGISTYTTTASNCDAIDNNIAQYGYIYENEHVTFNYEGWENVGNVQKYVKFSTVRVGGNMPQSAREDIEQTLKNGVHLFYVST